MMHDALLISGPSKLPARERRLQVQHVLSWPVGHRPSYVLCAGLILRDEAA